MLGEDELQDMIETDDGAEAICHFCNEIYHTDSDQLAQLIVVYGRSVRRRVSEGWGR